MLLFAILLTNLIQEVILLVMEKVRENENLRIMANLNRYWVSIRYELCILIIFSRQASLARQAFLITPLHGARYKTGKNAYAKKWCYVIICKINAPSATLVFPTIPLSYAKDQCEALSQGKIVY